MTPEEHKAAARLDARRVDYAWVGIEVSIIEVRTAYCEVPLCAGEQEQVLHVGVAYLAVCETHRDWPYQALLP